MFASCIPGVAAVLPYCMLAIWHHYANAEMPGSNLCHHHPQMGLDLEGRGTACETAAEVVEVVSICVVTSCDVLCTHTRRAMGH
jgi:hypothetical protein